MQKYLKAFYAAWIAAAGTTSAAYEAGHGHIGLVAGLTIGTATVSAGLGVWGVSNQPSTSNVVWGDGSTKPPA